MAKIVPLHNDIPVLLDLEPTVDPLRERFSNDVLPLIEQGKRLAGIMDDGTACTICYTLGDCDVPHAHYEIVPYQRIFSEGMHTILCVAPMPYTAFRHFFRNDDGRDAIHLYQHRLYLSAVLREYSKHTHPQTATL